MLNQSWVLKSTSFGLAMIHWSLAQMWRLRWLVSATGLPTLNRTAKYVAEGIHSRIDIHPKQSCRFMRHALID